MIWMEDGTQMREGKAVVEEMQGQEVRIFVLRPPRRLTLSISDILSCDYTRDDEGLT